MNQYVYVVTCPELGWDCVVGIFDENMDRKELNDQFPEGQYVISKRQIENNLEDY